MEPKNRFHGIDSASLCSLVGRYDNRVVVPARQAENRFLGSLKGLQIRTLLADPLLQNPRSRFLISGKSHLAKLENDDTFFELCSRNAEILYLYYFFLFFLIL
jgi:hypothetical protein